MARNHLLYKVWKTLDEGLSILEEAATQEGVAIKRLEKGIFVAGALVQPTRIPRTHPRDSKGSWQGYKAFSIGQGADGKPTLGAVLYEGIDPVMAVRFATGKMNPADNRK